MVGGDKLRKVAGIKKLVVYLDSVSYPLTEEQILNLMTQKAIPHLRPIGNTYIFNLDHIDGWIDQKRTEI